MLTALLLAGLLWATSLYHTLKFFGWAGALVYLCIAPCGVWLALSLGRRIRGTASRTWGRSLEIGLIALSVILLAAVYPRANAQDPTRGSDRDDALNVGAAALLRGEWPYNYVTYQGLPISPLPGALILASPFVVLGLSSAWQVPLWLAAYGFTARQFCASALAGGVALLLLFPMWAAMVQEIATGGDYTINSLYVLCPSLWLVWATRRCGLRYVVIAALCGVAFASRLNYLVIIPALLAAIAVEGSGRRAFVAFGTAAAVFVMLSIPFYLHDPTRFGPALMQDKFSEASPWLAGKGWLMGLLAATTSAFVGVQIIRQRLKPAHGLVLAFFACNLLPASLAAMLQVLVEGQPPLFIRWASMAVPALILLLVRYADTPEKGSPESASAGQLVTPGLRP